MITVSKKGLYVFSTEKNFFENIFVTMLAEPLDADPWIQCWRVQGLTVWLKVV
jgi:hypothetical protein